MADYKAAQALAQAEGQAEALYRQQVLTRMAEGAKVKTVADQAVELAVSAKCHIRKFAPFIKYMLLIFPPANKIICVLVCKLSNELLFESSDRSGSELRER